MPGLGTADGLVRIRAVGGIDMLGAAPGVGQAEGCACLDGLLWALVGSCLPNLH